MKCKQSRSVFEHCSQIPFPTTIIIAPLAPSKVLVKSAFFSFTSSYTFCLFMEPNVRNSTIWHVCVVFLLILFVWIEKIKCSCMCKWVYLILNSILYSVGKSWGNGYRRRKCTRRHEFKSWTRLIEFHIALIPLGKVWIQLLSLQLWVNSRAD